MDIGFFFKSLKVKHMQVIFYEELEVKKKE